MSSTYRILCIGHDPALVLDDRSWNDHAQAVQAIAAGVSAHPSCRLLVGRWSAALIEVGCPRMAGAVHRHSGVYHPHDTEWVDAGWLRLMALSTPEAVGAAQVPGCWDRDIARRLARILGLEET